MDALVDSLDTLLDRSVDSQLMSEVPLGAFCSGGVDSGVVTGYAARHSSHTQKPSRSDSPTRRGTRRRWRGTRRLATQPITKCSWQRRSRCSGSCPISSGITTSR
jgi:hypothetical protein